LKFTDDLKTKFKHRKVVILGDLVADQFLRGTIARVSREAPVFILRHDDTETLGGGAANAAVNVSSLGGNAVCVGFTGTDASGDALRAALFARGVDCSFVISSPDLQTTTKVRVLAAQHYAQRQQVIRIDYENQNPVSPALRGELKANLIAAAADADAIIISDYSEDPAFGVVNAEMAELAVKLGKEKGIPVVVDSRFRLDTFRGATSATPNQDEVEHILGKNFSNDDCVSLKERLGFASLLVTRGNKGMLLCETDNRALEIDSVGSKEPVDVTGAGDTVIAAFSLSLASGFSFPESARIANHAGGIVVMKKQTASASIEELIDSLNKFETDTH
jgi:rfaE bifunctional protein kinase chain/domain